jgi:hypothetical protein
MTRGPVSEQAIAWALPLARLRGTVYCLGNGPESPCHFEIVSSREIVFVRVKRTRCLHQSPGDLEMECRDHILRLRAIPAPSSCYRELWVCSRYGRWRFFRVTETGIGEITGPVPGIPQGQATA